MLQLGDSVFPEAYEKSLKALEALVVQAREAIRKLDKENGVLRKQVRELKSEKRELTARTKRLQQDAKRSMMSRGRSNLAKAKIQEIIRRIEQVETEGDPARDKD